MKSESNVAKDHRETFTFHPTHNPKLTLLDVGDVTRSTLQEADITQNGSREM